MPMQEFNRELLFPELVVVAYANLVLGNSGIEMRVLGAVQTYKDRILLIAQSKDGQNVRLIAPIFEYGAGVMAFRSILKEDHVGKATWTNDGRATYGCSELALYDVADPDAILLLKATRASVASYYRSGRPGSYQEAATYAEDIEVLIDHNIARSGLGNEFEVVADNEVFKLYLDVPGLIAA